MFRKQRQPAPFFNMPGAPFNPATGERSPLGVYPPRGTTLALFQVVGDDPNDPETADTHDNYVVCRGYEADADPNFRYLHDPYTKEDTTPINVAKPYSLRGTFPYTQGQVIVAARIKGRLGYNAGKAETTVGQPGDLDEEVVLLRDDDDAGISWLDLGQGGLWGGCVVEGATNASSLGTSETFWSGGTLRGETNSAFGITYDSVTGVISWVRSSSITEHLVMTAQTAIGIYLGLSANADFDYQLSVWTDLGLGGAYTPLYIVEQNGHFRSTVILGNTTKTLNGSVIVDATTGGAPAGAARKYKLGIKATRGSPSGVSLGVANWFIFPLRQQTW